MEIMWAGFDVGRVGTKSVATLLRLAGRRKMREGTGKRRKALNHRPERNVEWRTL